MCLPTALALPLHSYEGFGSPRNWQLGTMLHEWGGDDHRHVAMGRSTTINSRPLRRAVFI